LVCQHNKQVELLVNVLITADVDRRRGPSAVRLKKNGAKLRIEAGNTPSCEN